MVFVGFVCLFDSLFACKLLLSFFCLMIDRIILIVMPLAAQAQSVRQKRMIDIVIKVNESIMIHDQSDSDD